MLFNSFVFAVFLPLVFAVYQLLPAQGRRVFLLAASYVFYCWAIPVYGVLILGSTLLDYVCGLWMGRAARPAARRAALTVSICGNLGLLFFFKYADFLGGNFFRLLNALGLPLDWAPLNLLLPVGISFYTFQTMSYTIQVYRRQIEPTRDVVSFALYVSFFPQLVAGPIERASDLLPQLLRDRRTTVEDVRAGLTRIVFGLFRKLVLADRFAILADRVYAAPDTWSTADAWMAAFAFFAQVYYDFAGYSDIAIGTARLFGVRLSENFRRPLLAASKAEFWGRWHLTLTAWLRDYLFNVLGGFRLGWKRGLLNGWIVLLLCGLWHGAAWNFVMWGAVEALALSGYYLWRHVARRRGWTIRSRPGVLSAGRLGSIALTLTVSSLCTVFFRSPDLGTVGAMARALAGLQHGDPWPMQWDVPFFAVLLGLCLAVEMLQEYTPLNARVKAWPAWVRMGLLAVVAALTALTAVSALTPYIYFQF
jgi:alginate O-acetyltransferase complex protein AlgI